MASGRVNLAHIILFLNYFVLFFVAVLAKKLHLCPMQNPCTRTFPCYDDISVLLHYTTAPR
jgi:hypothetical protein